MPANAAALEYASMTRFRTLDDIDPAGKRVLVRVDFNVPIRDGAVSDATRIERAAATIRELTDRGAKVVLLSHFGRPKGARDPEMSLRPIVPALSRVLGGAEVAFAEDCVGETAAKAVDALADGGVALLENLRFHAGEEKNDEDFARRLAELGDIYVNDAFSAAHRAHASVEALARLLPAAAGRLMQEELEHLEKALENPAHPVMAVVGGAKISTKLDLLTNLVAKVDVMVIGGAMANTFLFAMGRDVGQSLCETDMRDTVDDILARARQADCELLLPNDVVVAPEFKEGAPASTVAVTEVPGDRMILDLGPRSVDAIGRHMERARTLVWNGPLGAFEVPPFDRGTNDAARKAAGLTRAGKLLSVAGGGDTVAALAHAGVLEDFSYVSSAGGAFLEWLEGKTLPGVKALQDAS
jgi:phosphoglycerate kinase